MELYRTAFEVANAAGTNFVIDGLGNVGIQGFIIMEL